MKVIDILQEVLKPSAVKEIKLDDLAIVVEDKTGRWIENWEITHALKMLDIKIRYISGIAWVKADIDPSSGIVVDARYPGNGTSHPTLIYFVRSGEDGPIKIGITKNLGKRMQTLKGANPTTLTLMGTMPGGFKLEQDLHRRFSNLRIHNEWFTSSPELLTFIEQNIVTT